MPPKRIFLDECGYTGDDLLDEAQPVFAIATHDIDEEEATDLKKRFFGGIKADELKHQSLQRRKSSQCAVLHFANWLVENPHRTRTVVGHKKFALTAKLVDFVMEPGLHRAGIDLRDRGGLAALSNMLFAVLQADGSPLLDVLLARFQKAARTLKREDWMDFVALLGQDHVPPPLDEVMGMIRTSTYTLVPSDILGLPKHPLDISLTLSLNCIYRWKNMGYTDFTIFHDQSTNMARQRHFWDAILSPTAPPATVGNPDFQVTFPIGVQATNFSDSRASNALQLADVIAGAACRWAKWLSKGSSVDDAYAQQLHEVLTKAAEGTFVPDIWPTGEVGTGEEQPPGVSDSLDYLVARSGDVVSSQSS